MFRRKKKGDFPRKQQRKRNLQQKKKIKTLKRKTTDN